MNEKKLYLLLIWFQGIYYLLTALWGLTDIDSFMAVTGPKTDTWLVKTVSVLLLPIVALLLSAHFFNLHPVPVIIVGILSAGGLAAIEFYYTSIGRIKWVYAADGAVQTLMMLIWIYLLSRKWWEGAGKAKD